MLSATEYKTYWEKAFSYAEYIRRFEKELKEGGSAFPEKIPINWQRNSRVTQTFELDDESLSVLADLVWKRHWLVITEHWCGDSAQIIPVMNKIAEASNGKIELRMIYRDDNLTLMNAHLTNGGKSIPKLIQLDKDFRVTGEYGPRPVIAQKLVLDMKSNPATAPRYSEELHKWYAKDRQVQILRELMFLLDE